MRFLRSVFILGGIFVIIATSCRGNTGVSGDASVDRERQRGDGDSVHDGVAISDGDIDTLRGDGSKGACPHYGVAKVAGIVTASALDETSGIVSSRAQADILWAHNDSGDKARFYAIDVHGRFMESFRLDGVTARDWEDVAIGKGPSPGQYYLYAADIGDNNRVRSEIQIYRIAEPHVGGGGGETLLTGAETYTLRYPDGPHNAETLLIDPRSGTIYLITKEEKTLQSQIFRVPVTTRVPAPTKPLTLIEEGALQFHEGLLKAVKSGVLTGGDVAPDGSAILLRTYGDVLWYAWPEGKNLAEALVNVAPCILPVAWEVQGESIAFAAKGGDYFTLSESDGQALYRYPLL
ncbi:MAG: hypothetical protein KAI47_06985 [Deltaproteobacteria bacterium]|nr:hypothetical protein [Deltaproteobacteria bacterium]